MRLDEIMISLLAREVLHKEVNDAAIKRILTENSKAVELLYELSKMHDLSHIVCLALKNIGVWGKDGIFAKFQRQLNLAVYRYEQLEYELGRVSSALESAKIPYMPLKGAVIRSFYPEGWMRTSSDIDILVEEKNKKTAQEILSAIEGYTLKGTYQTETTFHTDKGMCIELHHMNSKSKTQEIPHDVWTKVVSKDGIYRKAMSGEMLYCHVVAHLTKHITNNGCGLKPFLDMYILERKLSLDAVVLEKAFEKQGLLKAYKALRSAMLVWFEGKDGDKLTEIIQRHVMLSGSYGNTNTGDRMRHRNKGGKIRYILSLFLPDRAEMQRRYPILKEHPKRLPIYHFKRWGHLIFHGRIKSSAEIIGKHMAVPDEEVKKLEFMIKKMGLDKK